MRSLPVKGWNSCERLWGRGCSAIKQDALLVVFSYPRTAFPVKTWETRARQNPFPWRHCHCWQSNSGLLVTCAWCENNCHLFHWYKDFTFLPFIHCPFTKNSNTDFFYLAFNIPPSFPPCVTSVFSHLSAFTCLTRLFSRALVSIHCEEADHLINSRNLCQDKITDTLVYLPIEGISSITSKF